MILRLDHLLDELRCRGREILAAIDADPQLIRRQSGPFVIANAGKTLYTPQESHQLFAKGIVYRRDPFELVSLPLIKIYNLGEKEVHAGDLAAIADGPTARMHFLRKFDGTLIQRFQHDGRVYLTTRGMIEGGPAASVQDEDAPDRLSHFDFLGNARRIARDRYPLLCEPRPEFEALSLVFEFLHPETRIITKYGERQDLVLLACFDRRDWRYHTFAELRQLAAMHGLAVVDDVTPSGKTLAEQIDRFLGSIAGTDQEGTVIAIERDGQVIYRVKVKSPDYLRVLKLLVTCNYTRTAEMIDAHPEWTSWADLESHLRMLGREQVPEEVLGFYREHYVRHAAYLADCARLCGHAQAIAAELLEWARAAVGPAVERRLLRKAFAARAVKHPLAPLLFAAFDGRLTVATTRPFAPTPEQARAALQGIP